MNFAKFQEILEKGPERSVQSWTAINIINSKGVNLLKSNSQEELVPDGLRYSNDVFVRKYIPLL